MKFDPRTIFYTTFFAMIGQGVTSGVVHLTGLMPAAYIPTATAWISLLTFVALAFLSLATGYAGAGTGPFAPPATPEEARKIAADAGVKMPPAGSVGKTF